MKISWFFSLRKTNFLYQIIAWTWLMNSCWLWTLSMIYLTAYNLLKAVEKFILKCLMSSSHYIFILSLYLISSFNLKLNSCIYHCRMISWRHFDKLILTVSASQNFTTFWIQSQKRWIFWMRVFFLLNMILFSL